MDDVPRRPDVLPRRRGIAYHVVAVVLIAFGVLGILSIGLPFLVGGVLLLALAPNRHRPEILWPPLAALAAWTATYAVAAPWGCSQTISSTNGAAGSTTMVGKEICRTAFGVGVGNGLAEPALVASAAAGIVFAITRVALVRQARRRET